MSGGDVEEQSKQNTNRAKVIAELQSLKIEEQALVQVLTRCNSFLNQLKVEELHILGEIRKKREMQERERQQQMTAAGAIRNTTPAAPAASNLTQELGHQFPHLQAHLGDATRGSFLNYACTHVVNLVDMVYSDIAAGLSDISTAGQINI